MMRMRIRSWPSAGAVGKRKSGPRARSANARPSKQLPAIRLVAGVRPAKDQRRQRTATPHPATTRAMPQPDPPAGRPAARTSPPAAPRGGSEPSPPRWVSPAEFSRRTASPRHPRLVDKSLLAVERKAGATRFRMLDFVRQYAAERLVAAGEDVALADRHRAYFRELAQRADRELWALVPAGRARLDDESPNLRAAIDDGCARAPDDALAMVGALGLYWRVRGRLAEGVTATEQSLGAAPPEPSPERALALAKLSNLSFWLGDFVRTQSSATSALEMGAAIGDTRSQALALNRLGALVILGDPGAGDPMLMRAAELARTAGDDVALCDALTSLAISYFCQDDPGAMRSPLEEALRVAEAIGFEDDIRWCLWCLAHTAFSAGDLASARAHGERALAMMPGQDQLSRYCAVEILCLLDANMGAADAARERA